MSVIDELGDVVVPALEAMLERPPTEREKRIGGEVMAQMVFEGKADYTPARWFEWHERVAKELGS